MYLYLVLGLLIGGSPLRASPWAGDFPSRQSFSGVVLSSGTLLNLVTKSMMIGFRCSWKPFITATSHDINGIWNPTSLDEAPTKPDRMELI